MLKSKPIGWITAGTLVCLAGVALACRFRDGKEVPAEASVAACCDSKEVPKPDPVRESDRTTSKKQATAPAAFCDVAPPALLSARPRVGEQVEEAKKPLSKPAKTAESAPAPGLPAVPVLPTAADKKDAKGQDAALAPVVPLPGECPAPPASPPRTKLLSPGCKAVTGIQPVSGKEVEPKSDVIPASFPPPPPVDATKPDAPAKKSTTTKPADKPFDQVPPPPGTEDKPVNGAIPPVKPPEPATTKPTPSSAKVSAPAEPTYKVSGKGESLREIAGRTLNSEDRWPEICKLNPELGNTLVAPAGKVLRLPSDAKVVSNSPRATPGGSETQDVPATKVSSVRPLPIVRHRMTATKVKVSLPLTGTYSCKLDDKRGMILPKEVCMQLGKDKTILLTPGPDQCLWLGTQTSALRVLEGVEKSGADSKEVQTFRRLYYSQSEKAVVDGSGKLAISAKLAEYAGLSKEVVVIGIDDHFELWDAVRWQRYSQHKDSSPKP